MMVSDTITMITTVLFVISGSVIIFVGVPILAGVMSDTIMVIAGAVIMLAVVMIAGGFVVMSQTGESARRMRRRVRVQIGLRHRVSRASGAGQNQHHTHQRNPSSERKSECHVCTELPDGPCSQDSPSRSTGRWTIR